MKKCIVSAIAGALAMLVAIMVAAAVHANKEQTPEKYAHIDYTSAISQDACYVCGDVKTFAGSFYWGEDNVGIVNLNTFELLRLELKRYDDHGKLIEEPAGFMSSGGMAKDDAGSSVHAFCFPDNGYADAQIFDVQYAVDRNVIQNSLCQTCLDSINDLCSTEHPPAEYAIISFEDRTIRPLLKAYPWFSAGNYGIDCDFGDNGKIDLLIHDMVLDTSKEEPHIEKER